MACLKLYWRLADEVEQIPCHTNADGSWRTWRQADRTIGTPTNMDRVIAAWLRALLDEVRDRSRMAAKNPAFASEKIDIPSLHLKFSRPLGGYDDGASFHFVDRENCYSSDEHLIGSGDVVVAIVDQNTEENIYFDCDSTEIEPLIAMLKGGF